MSVTYDCYDWPACWVPRVYLYYLRLPILICMPSVSQSLVSHAVSLCKAEPDRWHSTTEHHRAAIFMNLAVPASEEHKWTCWLTLFPHRKEGQGGHGTLAWVSSHHSHQLYAIYSHQSVLAARGLGRGYSTCGEIRGRGPHLQVWGHHYTRWMKAFSVAPKVPHTPVNKPSLTQTLQGSPLSSMAPQNYNTSAVSCPGSFQDGQVLPGPTREKFSQHGHTLSCFVVKLWNVFSNFCLCNNTFL